MKSNGRINWPKVDERLALLRAALGITQKTMCDATGIDTSSWNRFERGQRPIMPDDLAAIYEAYGVDANFILFGREDGLPARILRSMRRLRSKA